MLTHVHCRKHQQRAREHHNWTRSNGRRWPGLMNHFFFYITWMSGCVRCLPGEHMAPKCTKKISWWTQCDALGNVLLGNLGSCHQCSMLLWHVPPTWALLQTTCTLSWKRYSLMAVASFSRIMLRATKQQWFRNGLRSTTTSLRCWVVLQIPQISMQLSICGIYETNMFDLWGPDLTTYST